MASRLNVVDYAQMEPVSPSHAIVQLDERKQRPRKRERGLASAENLVGQRQASPLPDAGLEIRVPGPAGWAVTETCPSPRNTEEGSSPASPLRMRRARTAWSDDVTSRCDENEMVLPSTQQNRSAQFESS